MTAAHPAGSLQPPLAPRDGHTLKVLGIARISTEHQDALSLADQESLYRQWLAQHAGPPFALTMIAGRGSGECLDRQEALRATAEVETGTYDLVIAEDLGRIFRRVHAQLFCELCEDVGTRLVAINDHVDTGGDGWQLHAFFATMRHEMYNADTARRIRRSLRNRFCQGGVFQCPIYGYDKPPGAKGEDDVRKDPAATPIYEGWFRRLDNGATYAEVADWLNGLGIPTGPHCRKQRWDGPMVSRVTHNPLLKGLRVRNAKISRRVNKTGRRRSVQAPPEERLERHCPRLAFFEPAYYDRVVRKADRRNARYRRKGANVIDTRKDVPKRRSTWPGQHLRCGVCGRACYWTGLKQRKWMVCSGAQQYKCWNSLALNGGQAGRKLAAAILAEAQALPEHDACFLDMVRRKTEAARDQEGHRRQELQRRREELARQISRVTDAIAAAGGSRLLLEKVRQLEAEQEQVEAEAAELSRVPASEVTLPSVERLKQAAAELLAPLAAENAEAHRLMQKLIPDLKVYPYRLCDGGAVVLRARFTLHLASLAPKAAALVGLEGAWRREMQVDLFDPPQRVVYRERVVELRAAGLTERQVAQRLGITPTAAQRAAALDRRMRQLGTADPYQPLREPPPDFNKLRRHRHPRYRFEPLDDGVA
jgi:DNA invertase Pin-like site-specific DNA recombinase